MPKVQQDSISQLSVVAVVLVVLFTVLMVATFDPWLMPLYLLAGSAVIYFFGGLKKKTDRKITRLEAGKIGVWSLLGLAGLALIGVVSHGLFVGTIPTSFLAIGGATLTFSAVMAVSETVFFQGSIYSFFSRYGPYLAIAVSVALGIVFHLQVYGTSPANLAYAGLGYGLLSWLVFKTGRLSVAIIVHVANNVMASLMGSVIVFMLAAVAFAAYASQKKISWRKML